MAAQPLTEWSNGLPDCFEDVSTCCYGFWCCPCLAGTVAGRFGENRCLLLFDVCTPAVFTACGIPLFIPPAVLSLRSAMRNRYGIKGTLCKDIVVSCFCMWCSWCQMHRELKHRKKDDVDVNMEPIPAVRRAPGHPPPAGFVSQ
ncbi:cornifelin isoform X4 [Lates calcarifer]|uniref:Cornifelin isoform X4 n=1 Tax=Lates calcarifer TaxID=8187 RepID=A0AAJ8BH24_LATCA|nr:cornifelin isoform X4 [Lates calcarifer]